MLKSLAGSLSLLARFCSPQTLALAGQDLVGDKRAGLASVGAGRVNGHPHHCSPVHQPLGSPARHSGEVEVLRVLVVSGSGRPRYLCLC